MSVESDEIPKSGPSPKKRLKAPRSRARKIWTWIGYAVLFLVFVLVIAFLILWDRRYSIAERYVQTLLQDQGIETSLSIETLTREAIVLNDVTLTYRNEVEPFFKAKRVEADFILKEALNGKMKRLRFVEADAAITLGENFQITDGWLPPQESGSTGGVSIPENGLFLEDVNFSLTTPYGSPDIALTAAIRETDQFEATVLISPTALNYEAWQAEGSARLDLTVKGNRKDIDALVRIDRLSGTGLNLTDATLEVTGPLEANTTLPIDLNTLDLHYEGTVAGTAEKIKTEGFNFETSRFVWSGNVTRNTASKIPIGLNGQLDLSTQAFSFTESTRAREVAETLTLSDALSKTPIAQHFAPSVTRSIEQLIERPSFDASVDVLLNEVGGVVSLRRPLNILRNQNELSLEAASSEPLYAWSRQQEQIELRFDASLIQPVSMALQDTAITANSDNGWQLQGISAFEALVKTAQTWRVEAEGEAARLAPFKGKLDYNVGETYRRLFVDGSVDFDGRLPGGYVRDFKTKGRVDLTLPPAGQSGLFMGFRPSQPRITIDTLLTDTDWRLDNVAFDLVNADRIFVLDGNDATIQSKLKNLSFEALNSVENQNLSMTLQTAKADGLLDTTTLSQNWDLNFKNAQILSDTIPVAQTQIDIPAGYLSVQRAEDIQFDFNTPSLDMSVPQGSVKDLKLSANGTLDNYTAVHSEGVFSSKLAEIPDWPLTGEVTFKDNRFDGRSTVLIPEAKNTPLTIDYQYGEGKGEAHIVLESLIFTQNGLQPQILVPAFAGKIAAVEGEVSADLNLRYTSGEPLDSDGILSVKNMSFGTAPGPVTGLNTDIRLTSLFPIETAGRQTLTVENFDPGFPLENGSVEYELVTNGVKIHNANWPIGAGAFALDPFTWTYNAPENRVVMRLNEIPIEEFLNNVGNGKLEATGTVRGEFPIVVRGLNVLVDNGYLEAKDGGIIRYAADEGDAVTYSQDEALDIIRRQDTAQYRSLARDALREFAYRELTASINGPLDGDVQLGIIFDGTNKKVLNGQPFEFDIDVQGELFNILRSFNSNAQIKSEILRKQAEKNALQ
jgi:hypothetical protein